MIAQFIWTAVAAAGIPSAIIGIVVGRLSKKMDKRDKEKEAKEVAREQHEIMMIEMSLAALSLSEATAKAVQRIPDAHCNGDMHEALKYANEIKNKYRDFERRVAVQAMS